MLLHFTSSYSFSLGADSKRSAITLVCAMVDLVFTSLIRLLLTADVWKYRAYLNWAFCCSSIISFWFIGGNYAKIYLSLDYIKIELLNFKIWALFERCGNEPCCDAATFQFRVAGFLLAPQTWREVEYEDANLCDFRLLQSFHILPSIVSTANV